MIRRKRKISDLDRQLKNAHAEHRKVVREGEDREPMLRRLNQRLEDNGFMELLIVSMERTRRRPT
jgi:HKD family nuclease